MQSKITIPVTDEPPISKIEPRRMTDEQMQRDMSFRFAQRITQELLEKGLISQGEFNKLSALNREKFCPYLAELMG